MRDASGPQAGEPIPSDVAALRLPLPILIVWLRHVG